jgi:phospholipid/cholesterol/gamma-HCH transport system substrate-binding protein
MGKQYKVGFLWIVGLVIGIFGFNFLKGSDTFSRENDYHVTFATIDGLTASNPVMLNGLQIGKVKSIKLLPEKNNALDVILSINKNIEIPKGSEAILTDNGLLGGKMITLKMAQNSILLADGETLTAKTEQSITNLLKERSLPILDQVDVLVKQLNTVTASFDSTGMYLDQVLRNSNGTVTALNGTIGENRAALKTTLTNINTLTANLTETEKSLKPILGKFGGVADSLQNLKLAQTLETTQRSLKQVQSLLATIEHGNGTVGKLMKSDSLYKNLNQTMLSLDQLFVNLKAEPKRYVHFSLFGKKDKTKKTETPK